MSRNYSYYPSKIFIFQMAIKIFISFKLLISYKIIFKYYNFYIYINKEIKSNDFFNNLMFELLKILT
jgi:hypothetical protein